MTKAARLLNVAQPALGLQIKQLEESLGTTLLERHSRGVTATPAGRLLYERALSILRLMDEAHHEVMAFAENRRETLTLGLTPSIVSLLGTELLVAARRELPEVLVSLVEEPSFVLTGGLERGEIDLALTFELTENPLIERRLVLTEELLLVMRPDMAPKGTEVPFVKAMEMDLVLIHERDMIRRMVEAEAHKRSTPVRVAYEVQSLQATRQVVLDGLAATIVPFGTVAADLRSGELVSRRLVAPKIRRRLYMARPVQRGRFAQEDAIMKLMRSVTKQLTIDLGDLAEAEKAPA